MKGQLEPASVCLQYRQQHESANGGEELPDPLVLESSVLSHHLPHIHPLQCKVPSVSG